MCLQARLIGYLTEAKKQPRSDAEIANCCPKPFIPGEIIMSILIQAIETICSAFEPVIIIFD